MHAHAALWTRVPFCRTSEPFHNLSFEYIIIFWALSRTLHFVFVIPAIYHGFFIFHADARTYALRELQAMPHRRIIFNDSISFFFILVFFFV